MRTSYPQSLGKVSINGCWHRSKFDGCLKGPFKIKFKPVSKIDEDMKTNKVMIPSFPTLKMSVIICVMNTTILIKYRPRNLHLLFGLINATIRPNSRLRNLHLLSYMELLLVLPSLKIKQSQNLILPKV